ncbi:MAG: polysaccharide biosynthesis/export family protein [Acidobacteriota bacterium]
MLCFPSLKRPRLFVSLLISLAALGAASSLSAQSDDYEIGARDLLRLKVFEAPEFDADLRVDERGIASHPIAGDLSVGGRTLTQARLDITEALESRFLQKGRATVSLEVVEFRSRPVRVIGAVNSPGELEFSGSMTLIEALTAAGGLNGKQGNVAYVLRRASNGLSDQVEIQLEELLVRGEIRANLPLFPNDLVNVPETVEVTVYCLGEVNEPGAQVFKSNERITLLAAIASAGGLTDRAARKVVIKRRQADGSEEEIVVDYKKITTGRREDVTLQSGDVVLIKQSFL